MITDAEKLAIAARTLHELTTLIIEHVQISRQCHDQVMLNAVIDAQAVLRGLND